MPSTALSPRVSDHPAQYHALRRYVPVMSCFLLSTSAASWPIWMFMVSLRYCVDYPAERPAGSSAASGSLDHFIGAQQTESLCGLLIDQQFERGRAMSAHARPMAKLRRPRSLR